MVVGEPGAGKTTAPGRTRRAVGADRDHAGRFWPDLGEMPEDLIEESKKRFERNAESRSARARSWTPFWRWLRGSRRAVVVIDDVYRIAPDSQRGFMLRRALDELAGANLPAVVTTRPSGIPAGLATWIDLGELDPDAAADHVLALRRPSLPVRLEGELPTTYAAGWCSGCGRGGSGRCPSTSSCWQGWWRPAAARNLPPARAVLSELGLDDGRAREREDGQCEWNPLWVRYRLLDQFHDEIAKGRVHRWLAIEDRAARSCWRLSGVARRWGRRRCRRAKRPAERNGRLGAGEHDQAGHRGVPRVRRSCRDRRRREADRLRPRGHRHRGAPARARSRTAAANSISTTGSCRPTWPGVAWSIGRKLLANGDEEDGIEAETLLDGIRRPARPLSPRAPDRPDDAGLRRTDRVSSGPRNGKPKLVRNILARCVEEAENCFSAAAVGSARMGQARMLRSSIHVNPCPRSGDRADPDDALAKPTTAAEIARATNAKPRAMCKIVECAREARGTTMWTKLHAIPSLAALKTNRRWLCMWEFARDPDQEVRRAASEAISDDAFAAYRALDRLIRALLDRAALEERPAAPASSSTTSAGRTARAEAERGSPPRSTTSTYGTRRKVRRSGTGRTMSRRCERSAGSCRPWTNGLQEHAGPLAPDDLPTAQEGGNSDRRNGAVDASRDAENDYRKLVRGARAALEQLVLLAFQGGNSELEASLAHRVQE